MAERELAILITARDIASKALNSVARAATNVEHSTKRGSAGLNRLGTAAKNTSGNIKNLVASPLGLIGLGGAVFGVEQFLSRSVGAADEFGFAVARLTKVTGMGTAQVSQLVDALDKYGITADELIRITGFTEKNLDKYTKTTKASTKFTKEYGLQLRDSGGHVQNFNALLLTSADYFNNKSIPAQTKAAALAKIYGRNWASLIPILSMGSAKLKAVEGDSIKLTSGDIATMAQFKQSTREWDDALGDLQVMVGVKLMPSLTLLAKAASSFVNDHQSDIAGFFKDAAKGAQDLGHGIQTEVVPFIKSIADAWAKVPDDFKKLLLGGFVLNKLTGGAITDLAGEAVKGAIKGVLGITAGVVNITAGAVNGPGTLPPVSPTGGGGGLLENLMKGAVTAAAIHTTYEEFNRRPAPLYHGQPLRLIGAPEPRYSKDVIRSPRMDAAQTAADHLEIFNRAIENSAAAQANATEATRALTRAEYDARKSLYHREKVALHGGSQLAALGGPNKQLAIMVAAALAEKVAHSNAPYYRSAKNQEKILAGLRSEQKQARAQGDTKTAAALGRDIATVTTAIEQQKLSVSLTSTNVLQVDARKVAAAIYQVRSQLAARPA